MIKDIQFAGYATDPSPYESPDGQLAVSLNLINEDNQLKPLFQPKVLANISNLYKVFLHKNAFTHYIIIQQPSDGTLTFKWCDKEALPSTQTDESFLGDTFLTIPAKETFADITAVGNTFIVSSSDNIYYCLWRSKDNKYAYIGNSVPDINISFALKGELVSQIHLHNEMQLTEEETTTDEQWLQIGTREFTISSTDAAWKGNSGAQSNPIFFNATTLKENKEYSISFSRNSGTPSGKGYLYGINKSTTVTEQITSFTLGKNAYKRKKFTAKNNYSILYVVFSGLYTGSYTTNNRVVWKTANWKDTIYLEEGSTATIAPGKALKYNQTNYEMLMGEMNRYANVLATKKNRFIYPFFVRYATKMYDGTYMHISDPILMVPNSGYVPFMWFNPTDKRITTYAFISDLQYQILNAISSDWEDIVQGVDVFCSQPIYPYDQGQGYDSSKTLLSYKILDNSTAINEIQGLSYGNILATLDGNDVTDGEYKHIDLYNVISSNLAFGNSTTAEQWYVAQVAPNEAKARDALTTTATFYHVYNIKFDNLPTSQVDFSEDNFKGVDMDEGVLSTLATRTTLSDELMSNRTFASGKMFAYNNRLHLHSAKYRLPQPCLPTLSNQYLTRVSYIDIGDIYVYLRTDEGERIVQYSANDALKTFIYLPCKESLSNSGLPWIFYPDNRAYRIVINIDDTSYQKQTGATLSATIDLTLTQHPLLNGSYWTASSLDSNLSIVEGDKVSPATNDIVSVPRTIYISEPNNPFVFTSVSAVSVGCKEIYALSAAAKAMSTGQFGQFPLYAFTDNGVWALETATTGVYTARQPITRDVCISTESIAQLDNSVLFATGRGIMLLIGSTASCITDNISASAPFNVMELPQIGKLHVMLGHKTDTCVPTQPFTDFLLNCRIAYDYIHQRIIVFNPNYTYAYVYSMKSSMWGMMYSNLAGTVNAYPDCMAVDSSDNLVQFPAVSGETCKALYVTRPIKFNGNDIYKTINTLIQRGYFRRYDVGTVLYGSRDLYNWFLVSSSTDHYLRGFHGSPYKYYIVAGVATLVNGKSLYGLSADITLKETNNLR